MAITSDMRTLVRSYAREEIQEYCANDAALDVFINQSKISDTEYDLVAAARLIVQRKAFPKMRVANTETPDMRKYWIGVLISLGGDYGLYREEDGQ